MIPTPSDLVERVLQHLLKAHVHDMRQYPTLRVARALSRRAGKIEHVTLRNQRLKGGAEPLLQALRVVLGDLKTMHDVAGHVSARARQRAGVTDLAVVKDRDVGRSSAQLDDGATQLDLIGGEH